MDSMILVSDDYGKPEDVPVSDTLKTYENIKYDLCNKAVFSGNALPDKHMSVQIDPNMDEEINVFNQPNFTSSYCLTKVLGNEVGVPDIGIFKNLLRASIGEKKYEKTHNIAKKETGIYYDNTMKYVNQNLKKYETSIK